MQLVVVRRDTVAPVAVKIKPDTVECHAGCTANDVGRSREYFRQARIAQPKARNQSRHINVTVIRTSTLINPRVAVLERNEPSFREIERNAFRVIGDGTSAVIPKDLRCSGEK